MLRVMCFVCVMLLCSAGAFASGEPKMLPWAGAPAITDGPRRTSGLGTSHAWLVRERPKMRTDEPSLWQVYHVPPRRAVSAADGVAHGSPDGSLRVSAQLAQRPEGIAAWENQATFIFEPVAVDTKHPEAGMVRQVLSMSTVPRVLDIWADEPEGRLLSEPELPGGGRLAGFVGTPMGPVALTEGERRAGGGVEAGQAEWKLRVLRDRVWTDVELPKGAAAMSTLKLSAEAGGLSVIGVGARVIEWWRGRVEGGGFVWSSSSRSVSGELNASDAAMSVFLVERGSLYVIAPSAAEPTWSTVRVFEMDAAGPRLVTAISGARGMLGLLPMEGLSRLGLVWDLGATGAMKQEPLSVAEVSLWTGRTLYSGPAVMAGPLTRSDAVMLGAMLFLIAASVIVFVLRSDKNPDFVLPRGLALAEPSRRVIATLIDGGIALVIASRLIDMPITEIFSVEAAASAQPVKLMLLAMGFAFAHTTIAEVLFSRSIGKALAGCMVVSLPKVPDATKPDEGIERVAFGAAILRNGIKWGMPPVVALTFLEPSRRHRAEILTRTAVVVLTEDETDPPHESDGE